MKVRHDSRGKAIIPNGYRELQLGETNGDKCLYAFREKLPQMDDEEWSGTETPNAKVLPIENSLLIFVVPVE